MTESTSSTRTAKEPTFRPADLEYRARRWGTSRAAVRAALRLGTRKKHVTAAEAEQIVREFLKRPTFEEETRT